MYVIMDIKYIQIGTIAVLSIFIYLLTQYGRSITNNVVDIEDGFQQNIEDISKELEYKSQVGELNNMEQARNILEQIMNNNEYIFQICILSSRNKSWILKKENMYKYAFYPLEYYISSEETNQKYKSVFPEWYTTELLAPKWSQPFYSSEDSDRGFVLHYTTNVIDPENGQADPIINITCKSKVRKRSMMYK